MKSDLASILPLEKRKAYFRAFLKLLIDNADFSEYKNNAILLANHLKMLNKEPEWIQKLYLEVLDATFHKRFQNLLTNITFEDGSENPLAVHNYRVQDAFNNAGINWRAWHEYDKETLIEVEACEKIEDKDNVWKELQSTLEMLPMCYTGTVLYNSVRKDCIEIQKKKAMIFDGEFTIKEDTWPLVLFPKYCATAKHLLKKNIFPVQLPTGMINPQFLQRLVKNILRAFVRKPVQKVFSVNLWQREPLHDLFQGNYSSCCVSIGEKDVYPVVKLPGMDFKKHTAGILNYLTDLGIQVAELHDDDAGGVIGQCWLYVALDEGKPVLVADSFDIDTDYRNLEKQLGAMRECMFQFLQGYAAACGISKAILGRYGPMVNILKPSPHVIFHHVETKDLEVVRLPWKFEKLGGYYQDKPYFLESVGGYNAYLIAKDIPVTTTEKIADPTRSLLPDFLL